MYGQLNVILLQFRVKLAVFGKCQINLQPGRQSNSGYKIMLKQIFILFILQFL